MTWLDIVSIVCFIGVAQWFLVAVIKVLVRAPKSFCMHCGNEGVIIVEGRGVMCPKCNPKDST